MADDTQDDAPQVHTRRKILALAGSASVVGVTAVLLDRLGVFGGHSPRPEAKPHTDVLVSMYDPNLPLSKILLNEASQTVGGHPQVISPASGDTTKIASLIAQDVQSEEPVGVLTLAGAGNGDYP